MDADPTSTIIASGSADNTIRLWNIKTAKCLKVLDFNSAVKRVEFSEDGSKLLAVTAKQMGFFSKIEVIKIKLDGDHEILDERVLTITCRDSTVIVAGLSYLSKYIVAGHEDGSLSQYDARVWRSCHYVCFLLILPDRRTALEHSSPRKGLSYYRSTVVTGSYIFHYGVAR